MSCNSTKDAFIPRQLKDAIQYLYEPAGMKVTSSPQIEAESAEYGACRFGLDNCSIVFRVAKTTPTKIGQFVTLWKRHTPDSEIVPLDAADDVEFVVVSVADERHRGQFIFSRKILLEKGIISRSGKGGKRAFRVYPPWTNPIAKDAIKTQKWQLTCFIETGDRKAVQIGSLFQECDFSGACRKVFELVIA